MAIYPSASSRSACSHAHKGRTLVGFIRLQADEWAETFGAYGFEEDGVLPPSSPKEMG